MNASTLFARAARRSKALRREESLTYIEPCMDALARQRTFYWLGLTDESEILEAIREMRSNFDSVIHHYQHHGRAYLPQMEVTISHQFSWFFVAAYVLMTRGGINYNRVGSVMRGFFENTHAVVAVSNNLLDLIHNHKLWPKGEQHLEKVVELMGVKYNPIHLWPDADDVLAIANLVGFRRGEVITCKGYEGFDDEVVAARAEETIPPNVFGLLSEEQAVLLRRSFVFNHQAIMSMVPFYLTVPVEEGKDIEVVHAALVGVNCLKPEDNDPNIAADIRELLAWTRAGRLDPIPLLRSDNLSNRINGRFGFHLTLERNTEMQKQLLHLFSIFALSLTAGDPYLAVH